MIKIGSKQRLETLMQLGNLSAIPESMCAAFTLKVFDVLTVTKQTVGELSKALDCHEDSLERLLKLLSALKVIRKGGRFYRHYKHLEKYLRSDSNEYIGDIFLLQNSSRENWSNLSNIVKTGKNTNADSKNEEETAFFQRGMKSKNMFFAEKVVRQMDLTGKEKLLELCSGPGSFTCEFLKQNPSLQVSALDLPKTLPITKEMIEKTFQAEPDKNALLNRLSYVPSDIFEYAFEPSSFDTVFFADAMHIWGKEENLVLFQKVFQTLEKNGAFYIYDFYINAKETGPLSSFIFHNHMNVMTDKGKVYTGNEIKKMLIKAGFSSMRFQRTERSDHILISAKKTQ